MKYAGFFKRIFSLIYDSFLILGVILFLTLILVFLYGGYEEMGSIGRIAQLFIIIVSGPSYYIYFWLMNEGQTTGMQAWKIQLISQDQNPLNLKQAIIRCLASVFSGLILGIGYLAIFWSKEKKSWSDKISKTRVIIKEFN